MQSDSRRRDLRQLTWVIARTDGSSRNVECAYALDDAYVYRRETDLSRAVREPRYWRASQRELFADDVAWDQGRSWDRCDDTGQPDGKHFRVRINLVHETEVHAADAEGAKQKAVGRLNLPSWTRGTLYASARVIVKTR